jgi:hypothetical protein
VTEEFTVTIHELMASSTPRSSSSIVRLLDLLRVVSRLERRSGFSSTLGIDHNYFRGLSSPDELDWNESTRTLTVVVPMTDRLAFSSTGDDATANNAATTKRAKVVGNLSTFQALIDDMTTWAFVLADPQRGRAGVSVTLSTEWAPPPPSTSTYGSPYQQPPRHISVGDAVVIESTVNKVGTNVGFSTAAIRTMEGDPVCFGSHVKFLPLGFGASSHVATRRMVSCCVVPLCHYLVAKGKQAYLNSNLGFTGCAF